MTLPVAGSLTPSELAAGREGRAREDTQSLDALSGAFFRATAAAWDDER